MNLEERQSLWEQCGLFSRELFERLGAVAFKVTRITFPVMIFLLRPVGVGRSPGRWIDALSGSKLCKHSYRKVVGVCISICLDAEPEKRLNAIPLIFQMTTLLNDPRFQYLSNRADTLPDVLMGAFRFLETKEFFHVIVALFGSLEFNAFTRTNYFPHIFPLLNVSIVLLSGYRYCQIIFFFFDDTERETKKRNWLCSERSWWIWRGNMGSFKRWRWKQIIYYIVKYIYTLENSYVHLWILQYMIMKMEIDI